MKRFISFLLYFLFLLGVFGCSGSRHTTQTIVERIDSLYFYINKDSIVYVTDTQYVTKVMKEVERIDTSSEWMTQEWWDNLTRTWIDSLGRVYTEKYEKGNKQSNGKEQVSYISELEDSLSFYKSECSELRSSYDSLFKSYEDYLDVKKESKVEKESHLLTLWHNISFFVGCILGFLLCMALYKTKNWIK